MTYSKSKAPYTPEPMGLDDEELNRYLAAKFRNCVNLEAEKEIIK